MQQTLNFPGFIEVYRKEIVEREYEREIHFEG